MKKPTKSRGYIKILDDFEVKDYLGLEYQAPEYDININEGFIVTFLNWKSEQLDLLMDQGQIISLYESIKPYIDRLEDQKKRDQEYFKDKEGLISPESHRNFDIIRGAEIVKTNSLKFNGGSYLYFKDIKPQNITDQGFKIEDSGSYIEYVYIKEVKND